MEHSKPPMTVWLNDESCRALDYCLRGMCEGEKNDVYRVGPYVHINQFLEVVTRYANETAKYGLSYDREFVDIALQLAEEIREGK